MPGRSEDLVGKALDEAGQAAPRASDEDRVVIADDSLPRIHSRPELEYINLHRENDPFRKLREIPRSHRLIFGSLAFRVKKWLQEQVRWNLGSFFEDEDRFRNALVDFDNALAERSDRLLRELTERVKAVAERNDLFLAELDLRLQAIEAREQMRAAAASSTSAAAVIPTTDDALAAELAVDLHGDAGARLAELLPLLRGQDRVLVLGAGRGEVLEALRLENGGAEGVEASAALAAECRGRGIDVVVAGLVPHLESLAEAALGGLVVTHVSERFSLPLWPRIVAGAWRALRPGGLALFEGVGDAASAARLRWLLARQRFAGIEVRACGGASPAAGASHVLIARRSDRR